MQVTGKIIDISIDYQTNKPRLTLIINEKQSFNDNIDELKELDKLSIDIKKYREKRRINANNYAWLLMEKIAEKMPTPHTKDDIYEIMLQRYGTLLKMDDEIVTIARAKELNSSSSLHIKFIGRKEVNNKLLNIYTVIKGSSEYNTKEMSIFIDGVVSEAKELGIETSTPDEIARMKALWKEKEVTNE